jgi:putative glutathione S-transferase
MGQLVDGKWDTTWYLPDDKGRFQRPATQFRARITKDGSTGFAPEPGRYHLYASYACPWAHRVLILRALRGLERAIPVTIVDPNMGDDGWVLAKDDPDPISGATFLRDVYLRAKSDYTGRVTVPVLWDRKHETIVNNESRELMRMLDVECDAIAESPRSLASPAMRPKIDEVLDAIYEPINNGVYRAGFATKQAAYETACRELFAALDRWEGVLARQRYVCGEELTEADVALFTTLLRFDLVYYSHFKCNVRRIQDYPSLWGFVRDLYQQPAIGATCRLDHIKQHYYWSQTTINPTRVVPIGPTIDLDAPHGRGV